MFTGLIEDLGRVENISRGSNSFRIKVGTSLPDAEINLGDSIAVNGVCLTVIQHAPGCFAADVSPETLQSSNLSALRVGTVVNLERALRLDSRLGGHMVSGHIDTVGTVTARTQDDIAVRFSIEISPRHMRYVVSKGSVAIDGISLTVNNVTASTFSVAIIPHSLAKTTLQHYGIGSRVNIETDLLGRYVEKLLTCQSEADSGEETQNEQQGLSLEKLAKNGFF